MLLAARIVFNILGPQYSVVAVDGVTFILAMAGIVGFRYQRVVLCVMVTLLLWRLLIGFDAAFVA